MPLRYAPVASPAKQGPSHNRDLVATSLPRTPDMAIPCGRRWVALLRQSVPVDAQTRFSDCR